MSAAAALAAGFALGGVFFWGLWCTVRWSLRTPHAALWLSASALTRTALLLSCLHWIARGGRMSLLSCLCGVLAARAALIRRALSVG